MTDFGLACSSLPCHQAKASQLLGLLGKSMRNSICRAGTDTAMCGAEAQALDERQADAAAPLAVAHADTLEPKPAATAHVSSAGQPGQCWLHFQLDAHAVMHALDSSFRGAAGPALAVA